MTTALVLFNLACVAIAWGWITFWEPQFDDGARPIYLLVAGSINLANALAVLAWDRQLKHLSRLNKLAWAGLIWVFGSALSWTLYGTFLYWWHNYDYPNAGFENPDFARACYIFSRTARLLRPIVIVGAVLYACEACCRSYVRDIVRDEMRKTKT
jgi:hypothetical protein